MTLEEIIDSIDAAEFIGQYVQLEFSGGKYWGLSPFKEESTPSFCVEPDKGFWYDHSAGNGLGGNVFNFVKRYFNCSGSEAYNILAKYVGLTDEEIELSKRAPITVNSVIRQFKTKKKRQVETNKTRYQGDVMDRYEIRLDKFQVWINEGISLETLEKFQVRYDSYTNRLIYPIRDINGYVVNIGGRTLNPYFKERHIKKYMYYGEWGAMDCIYGLYENYENIIAKHEVIIFEGVKSVMIADTWGIDNSVALLTSHLNEFQFKQLIKLGVHIFFALDREIDIRKDKRIMMLTRFTEVYYYKDFRNRLDIKDSPVDKGRNVFELLYAERKRL